MSHVPLLHELEPSVSCSCGEIIKPNKFEGAYYLGLLIHLTGKYRLHVVQTIGVEAYSKICNSLPKFYELG